MKSARFVGMALVLVLSACAQRPKPAAVTPAPPVTDATAPPSALATSAPPPVLDPAVIATAQRNLRLLGYAGGKSGDMGDAAFQRAILAFEKDQGLAEDGRLSAALAEKLRLARAALLKSPAANRNAMFFYSGMPTRFQALGLIPPVPPGLVADAPANFLQPLRPGSSATYHLGTRGKDGIFKPTVMVTCQVGRIAQTNLPLGSFDAIAIDCRSDAPNPQSWHALYSPALGLAVRQQTANTTHDLVAMRPGTGNWPSAARLGLDWALTHALDTPASTPVEWSSTAVAPHFEIKAAARLSGAEAGLPDAIAGLSCRRFEMVQTGAPVLHFPGIACQNTAGVWSLPGTSIHLAAPASGIGGKPSITSERSAQLMGAVQ